MLYKIERDKKTLGSEETTFRRALVEAKQYVFLVAEYFPGNIEGE